MENVVDFVHAAEELQRMGTKLRSSSQVIHPATYAKAMQLLEELHDLEETMLNDLDSYEPSSL